jgi:excisionase family DNA binding protein
MDGHYLREIVNQIDVEFEGRHLIGIADMASYMDISQKAALNLIHRGDIEAFRIGKAYKIPRSALKVYLESASAHGDEK